MKVYIKIKNKTYKINFKTISRNILIILAFISITKYINIMNNYNKIQLERYSQFVEYAQKNDIAITQTNYESYIENEFCNKNN